MPIATQATATVATPARNSASRVSRMRLRVRKRRFPFGAGRFVVRAFWAFTDLLSSGVLSRGAGIERRAGNLSSMTTPRRHLVLAAARHA